jgi:hypothetical protein
VEEDGRARGVSELPRLRQLEEENGRLKRLVAIPYSTSTCCRRPSKKKAEPARRRVLDSSFG